jgi:cupin fold WbuC family metalloprotein
MSVIFFRGQDIIRIERPALEALKKDAEKAVLRRARLCLHQSHDDKVQEMVIAFCRDSYVPPHRHLGKSESFHVIEGELMVVFFDSEGNVTERLKMGAIDSGLPFLYRLSSSIYHTVIPLTEWVIIHETAAGPFVKEESFPTWAPGQDDAEGIKSFIASITSDARPA